MMGIRRTITFPERELREELQKLQDHLDNLEREVHRQEKEKWYAENRADEAEVARDEAEARLAIAVEALDKIQNCDTEIIPDTEEGFVIKHYDAADARDLAMIMASRALDEIKLR